MKIYIDFDDVLCETAKHFTKLAKELFGIDVPYREVQFFNLKKTFDLSDEQYEEMMIAGHLPENLLNYEETTGAADTIIKGIRYFEINGLMKATKSILSREDLLIRMSHHENGLMNTILKEFHYTVLINMVVKPVNRTMHII